MTTFDFLLPWGEKVARAARRDEGAAGLKLILGRDARWPLPLIRAPPAPTFSPEGRRIMTFDITKIDFAQLDFKKGGGLIPAVVQDADTLQVLTLAYMDEAALRETLDSGQATFFSRSRGGRWRKGETSGDFLNVVSVTPDCDGDAVVGEGAPRRQRLSPEPRQLLRRRGRAGRGPHRAAGAHHPRPRPGRSQRQLDRAPDGAGAETRRAEGRRGGRGDRFGGGCRR